MKKIILLLGVLMLFGCHQHQNEPGIGKKERITVKRGWSEIYTVNIKGHEYVVYEGWKQGGIVHSESCPNSVHKH